MVAPHNLSRESILNLCEFHGRGAGFVVVRHAIEPGAHGNAGAKNVRLLPDTSLQRNPQPHQGAF